jgi:RHS repeat-associated protein
VATPEQGAISYYRGLRRYELVNHLGNVLAVISDRKIAVPLSGSSLIAHYEPDVITATDYYPFGMRMPGRQYGNGPVFAGGDYDSTTLVNGYQLPADLTLTARPDRQPEEYVAASSIELLPGFSSTEGDSYQLYIADETYAGSGNQPPPGSADGKAGYRFGFNGKENDNEVKGEANQQDYGMRIYDPRMGKFLSVDPLTKKYPELTPYQFASNRPVDGIDEDGLEYHPSTINTERQNASESVSNVSMPYPPEEMIRQSIEKANQKNRAFLLQGHTAATVGPSKSPKNAYEENKLNNIRNSKYAEIGYGSDGSPGFLNNLAQNKTWNSAAKNLVIPAMEFASLVDGVGEVRAIYKGLRSLSKLEMVATKTGMTEMQLVTRAAQKAEAAIGGTGNVAGTLKHTYAKNLLSRYQSRFGGNLSLGSNYFNNGIGNRGFLDVVNHSTKTIYDFKFGGAVMNNAQFLKYSRNFEGYGIHIVRP